MEVVMGVRFVLKDDHLTAILSGEIDHHVASGMREEIDRKAGQAKPKTLTLDFAQVTFMDSSGIGLIMGRYRLMEALRGRLTVLDLSPQMKRVVNLSGVGQLVPLETSRPARKSKAAPKEEPKVEAESLELPEEIPPQSQSEPEESRDIYSHSEWENQNKKGAAVNE